MNTRRNATTVDRGGFEALHDRKVLDAATWHLNVRTPEGQCFLNLTDSKGHIKTIRFSGPAAMRGWMEEIQHAVSLAEKFIAKEAAEPTRCDPAKGIHSMPHRGCDLQ